MISSVTNQLSIINSYCRVDNNLRNNCFNTRRLFNEAGLIKRLAFLPRDDPPQYDQTDCLWHKVCPLFLCDRSALKQRTLHL